MAMTTMTKTTGTPIKTARGNMRYFVSQFHFMVDGCVNVNLTLFVLPDSGTLPVPDQPEQSYCETIVPGMGVFTVALTEVPASSQPVAGVGEPYGDCTVRVYWWLHDAVSFIGFSIVTVVCMLLPE